MAATFTQTVQRMGPRHEGFVETAKAGNIDLRQVFYMDIGAKFLDEKGVFLANTFRPDNLHPVAKGYDIWGEAVQSKLAELMK